MIDIIMAAFNGEKYLKDQIDSILRNTSQDWKLTIYDDGSTDGTAEILKQYCRLHPGRIVFVQNEKNLKPAGNFLKGTLLSQAPYVMFCDQDDVWDADKIALTLKKMKQLENGCGADTPAAVFTDARVVNERLEILSGSFFTGSHLNPRALDLPHLLMENKLIGCTAMINRALIDRLHTLPDTGRIKMHDWWFALVAAAFGKIAYLDQPTMKYRQHAGNVIGSKGFADYILTGLSSLQEQKEALHANLRQGKEFLRIYGKELPPEKRRLVKAFAAIPSQSYFTRRITLSRCHFYKSGIIKNIAVYILL